MKTKTFTLILFICLILDCFAQKGEIRKIKIDRGGNLINLYKSGMALNKFTRDPEKEITFYDINLKKNSYCKV